MASTQRLNEMDRSLRQSQASSIWAQCMTDEGSKPEILSSIAQTTEESTRLKPVWNDRSISLSSKIRLMRSRVTSVFLYVCESWTLTAELQRRIRAIEMRCYRKILRISYKDHVYYQRGSLCQDPAGNRTTRRPLDHRKGTQIAMVRTCLPFIKSGQNHLARHSERRRGRQRKKWEDNNREWTGLEFDKS